MKIGMLVVSLIGLSLTCITWADDLARLGYAPGIPVKNLVAKGYRWVAVNGPYACVTEQNVRQITSDHTDVRELPKGPRSRPRGLSLESKGAESAVQPKHAPERRGPFVTPTVGGDFWG